MVFTTSYKFMAIFCLVDRITYLNKPSETIPKKNIQRCEKRPIGNQIKYNILNR